MYNTRVTHTNKNNLWVCHYLYLLLKLKIKKETVTEHQQKKSSVYDTKLYQ